MRGEADEDGERVLLEPTDPVQVVQTQRYLFPTPVRDRSKEIGAGQSLFRVVEAAHVHPREAGDVQRFRQPA
jgi:hypothetical protein